MKCAAMRGSIRSYWHVTFLSTLFILDAPCFAQSVLPRGIGIIRLGDRLLLNPENAFDKEGTKVSLSDKNTVSFRGKDLLLGSGGADLQKLVQELDRYDKNSGKEGSLVDRLNLGTLDTDVKAKVNVIVLGLAYGLSSSFTIYAGVPWIQSETDAKLRFSDENNALALKAELGNLAFDELKAGLDQAAQVNAELVSQTLVAAGYQPLGPWKKSAFGDFRIGGVFDINKMFDKSSHQHNLSFDTFLSVPTGYIEHPDILSDASQGRGYYSLSAVAHERLSPGNGMWIAGALGGAYNFPTKVTKRVPEGNSNIVPIDRTSEVNLTPGADLEGRLGFGMTTYYVEPRYHFIFEKHLGDRYKGELPGNYSKLAEESETQLLSHQISIGLSTLNAFQRKQFPVPILLDFSWKVPFMGKNRVSEDYLELTLSAFFSTPFAEEKKEIKETKESKAGAKPKRKTQPRTRKTEGTQ
jgi:hypothetical protein